MYNLYINYPNVCVCVSLYVGLCDQGFLEGDGCGEGVSPSPLRFLYTKISKKIAQGQ